MERDLKSLRTVYSPTSVSIHTIYQCQSENWISTLPTLYIVMVSIGVWPCTKWTSSPTSEQAKHVCHTLISLSKISSILFFPKIQIFMHSFIAANGHKHAHSRSEIKEMAEF